MKYALIAFTTLYFYQFSSLALTCPTDQHLVKSHKRSAYFRADGAFVSASTVSAHCRQKPESYVFWQENFKDQRPEKWPYKNEKTKKWTLEETERVLEAICELPKELWNKSNYKIYRMDKSKDGGNPATSSENILILYDSAFSEKYNLSRVIAHEFAHEIYNKLDHKIKGEYQAPMGWITVRHAGTDFVISSRKENYVADDGLASPEEDFANNVEFFLFDTKKLQKITPKAFEWINKHFSDKFKIGRCRK
jgi:hypothetical protein